MLHPSCPPRKFESGEVSRVFTLQFFPGIQAPQGCFHSPKSNPDFKKMWARCVMRLSWSLFNLESKNQKGMHPNPPIFMYAPVFSITFPPQYYRHLPPMFGQGDILKQNHIEDETFYDIPTSKFYSVFLLRITMI